MKSLRQGGKYILGLDVSTKTIGIALFEDMGTYGDLILIQHISPKAKKITNSSQQLFEKSKIFEKEFLTELAGIGITKVIIEEPLLRSNNVYTIASLLRFNGMISKSVYEVLGVVPDYISSYDARAYAFKELLEKRTVKKNGEAISPKSIEKAKPVLFGGYPYDVDKKKVIWEKVSKLEPKVQWLKNKKGQLLKENYDSTDAYCAVLGYMNKCNIWK